MASVDRKLVQELDTTLNEATVVGLVEEGDSVAMVLDVLALPEGGDPRRVLVFSGVARVRVLLREGDDGPVVPLDGFDAVNRHLDQGELYGWEFFDLPKLTADWPERVSLDRSWGRAGQHVLFWFNDVIAGTIEFDGLAVRDRDGTPMSLERFAADGVRWWTTMRMGTKPDGAIIVSGRPRGYRWRRGFPWLSRRG